MKKALLIYRINRDDPNNAGVIKKCKAQAKAFRNLGLEIDMLWLCKEGILKNQKLIHRKKIIPHSLGIYLFYFFDFGPLIQRLLSINEYDLIYFRHPFFDPLLVRFLHKTKINSPSTKIVLEINAYPYDKEPWRFLHKVSLKMDQYFRKNAHQYIDAISHYGVEEKIWGIHCIPIRNGIEVDKIKVSQSLKGKKEIKLIAVGNWSHWHGLDRLIKGLSNYYVEGSNKIKIYLTIVGDGGEKKHFMTMTKELGLENYIRFLPVTIGDKLDKIFDAAHVGIGTLGLHRTGIPFVSSLKNREYCSRGIPFILSAPDLDFSEALPFVHYVPNDDSDIDLESLLEVFLKWKEEDRRMEIRKYAEEHLTWERQLLPVVQWLEA